MGFDQFMKKNQVAEQETVEYAATKTLRDEQGKPLVWKFRKIPSKLYFQNFKDTANLADDAKQMICMSCVHPNLRDKELQDSYGVRTPEALIVEMVPDLDEMAALSKFVAELNAVDVSAELEEAKN